MNFQTLYEHITITSFVDSGTRRMYLKIVVFFLLLVFRDRNYSTLLPHNVTISYKNLHIFILI